MTDQNTDEQCSAMERLIQEKEMKIEREYTRLGILTAQKCDEVNRKITLLTDEVIALKQALSKRREEMR